jgi:hypothetical protein
VDFQEEYKKIKKIFTLKAVFFWLNICFVMLGNFLRGMSDFQNQVYHVSSIFHIISYQQKDSVGGSELAFPRDRMSRDKEIFMSRCPFVPGQGQGQKSRSFFVVAVFSLFL